MRGYNHKKAAQLINYLAAANSGKINEMKAFKLIWLVDRLHLRRYARTVTGDMHVAMEWGPVPSGTKNFIENNYRADANKKPYFDEYIELIGRTIHSKKEVNRLVFSQTDIEVIDEILAIYNKFDQFELAKYSHFFPEWKRYEDKLATTKSSYPMQIEDFFENYQDEFGLFSDDQEDLKLSKEIFFEKTIC